MKVLLIVTINYGFAAYIGYPKVGTILEPSVSPMFKDLSQATEAMIEVSLLGEPIEQNWDSAHWEGLTAGQTMEGMFFLFAVWYYVLISTILLLNLLIAMLGDTFGTVKEQAVREWRYANLQLVLRLEVLASPFTDVRSGTPMGDKFFFFTRNVEKIEEGGGDDGPISVRKGMKPEVAAKRIQRQYREVLKPRLHPELRKKSSKGDANALPTPGKLPAPGVGDDGATQVALGKPTVTVVVPGEEEKQQPPTYRGPDTPDGYLTDDGDSLPDPFTTGAPGTPLSSSRSGGALSERRRNKKSPFGGDATATTTSTPPPGGQPPTRSAFMPPSGPPATALAVPAAAPASEQPAGSQSERAPESNAFSSRLGQASARKKGASTARK